MNRILVVEDESSIRETLVDLLTLAGYEVLEAEDGEIGCIKALSEQPDLIISDVNMPNIDGFEMLKMLRKLSGGKIMPPFIFLTARVETSDQRIGMNLGADDYISKPFLNTDVLAAVKNKILNREDLKGIYSHEERHRISGEIHDSGQQSLIAAMIGFKSVGDEIGKMTNLSRSTFETSLSLLDQAIGEIRSLSHQIKQKGLEKLLEGLVNVYESTSNLIFEVDIELDLDVPESIEMQMFRMIQELMNNIVKHAEGSFVSIMVKQDPAGNLLLKVKDDGKGFDQTHFKEGFGLKNLKTRVANLDGEIEIVSKINQGVEVMISIPAKRL